MSLKGPPPPRSPVSRLGSLPPLNPGYRPIYRPAEQPSYTLGAGRWRTAVQQARQTFVHDVESDEERAVSFVAAPLESPHVTVESGGLQVRPELELVRRRLGGDRAGGPSVPEAEQTSAASAAPTAASMASSLACGLPSGEKQSPGLPPGRKQSPAGQDGSPDIFYC